MKGRHICRRYHESKCKQTNIISSCFTKSIVWSILCCEVLGPLFELFFDSNQYFIQWGDTTPSRSLANANFRLDLRIIIKDMDNHFFDMATGEFSKQSATYPYKLYKDFTKSALTTKVNLNNTLKRVPYIPEARIKDVVMPMMQMTGLSCTIYGMNIVDKKVYTVQELSTFNYPTFREIKKGGIIHELLRGLSFIESMIRNIQEMVVEYNRSPSNVMSNIKKRKKKTNTKVKVTNIEDFISSIVPYPEDEDPDDDKQDEEQEVGEENDE